MTLVKWNNGETLPRLSEFFDNWLGRDMLDTGLGHSSMPAVNIREDKDNYLVEVAAPGMNKNDFNIEVDNGMMTISSEKQVENKEEESHYTRREFSYRSFSRTFTLPESVAEDKISAKYQNGVLNIIIPKKEEAKKKAAKQIKVS